jgi:hypothetical protein
MEVDVRKSPGSKVLSFKAFHEQEINFNIHLMTPENFYYLVASVTAPIAGVWALWQWTRSRLQRKAELRWRMAEAAWRLLDKVFDDPEVTLALQTLDGESDPIELSELGSTPVSLADLLRALDLDKPDSSAMARVLRRSMDAVLYGFERLDQAIQSRYILKEDILSPTRYYARLLYAQRSSIFPYASHVGYQGALCIIADFANLPGKRMGPPEVTDPDGP